MRGGTLSQPLIWPLGSRDWPVDSPGVCAQVHEYGADPSPDTGATLFLRWWGYRYWAISSHGGVSPFVGVLVSPSWDPWAGGLLHLGFAVDVGVTSVNSKGSKSVTLRQQRIFIQGSDNCMCCGGSPGKSCSGRDGGPTPEGSLSSNTPSCLYVELSTYTRLLTRACIMGGNGLPCHPDLHWQELPQSLHPLN